MVRRHYTARSRARSVGLTLVELLLVVALLVVIGALAVPGYRDLVNASNGNTAEGDMQDIANQIDRYHAEHGRFPDSLAVLGVGVPLDPWGNAYQYTNIANVKGKGKLRKDKNLVPINSDYDLYSKGPDGKSVGPLTAKHSRDDIIRANNGRFFGTASDY